MNIGISRIKNGIMGREWRSWSATVTIDGEPAFIATDEGNGGDLRFDPIPTERRNANITKRYEQFHKTVQSARTYAETTESGNLELLIARLADESEFKRKFDKLIATKLTAFDKADKRIYTYRVPITAQNCAMVERQNPNRIALNTMPRDKAFRIYSQAIE